MHLSCPLYIHLTCLESGLCESLHISELWEAPVRTWLVSKLPKSSTSARCYVLLCARLRKKYTIELDSSFKQKAYFSHFISSFVNVHVHIHTQTSIIHQIEKQYEEDKRRQQKMMHIWWCYIKVEEGKEERRDRESGHGGKQEGRSLKVRQMRQWTGQATEQPALSYIFIIATHNKWAVKAKKMPFKVTSIFHLQPVISFIICYPWITCKIIKLFQ